MKITTTITKERVEYLIHRVKGERLERTGADFPYYSDLLTILDDYQERQRKTVASCERCWENAVKELRESINLFCDAFIPLGDGESGEKGE